LKAKRESCGVEIGHLWVNRTRKHNGWIVRVERTSTTTVEFKPLYGPSHALGRRRRLSRDAFLNCYQLSRDGP
jgi:hypothetical protein